MSTLLRTLSFTTAIGAAAAGGVFFAFSGFVMPALRRLPKADGIAAMQSINVTAVRPPLMLLLFGTAAGCVAVGIVAAKDGLGRPQLLALLGAATYVVLVVIVTMGYHVPRNDALAALDAHDPSNAAAWTTYLTEWTRMNHVRALGGFVSAGLLIASTVRPAVR